ncbi:MAG: hypothetical protein HYT73_04640 [Candidatus Aenigmarchaeota archaeon]|nr:hypothetical protein [Candidatus Aenigmarchaeota archaeon]
MQFYDLHVHSTLSIGEDGVEEMAGMARRLGLSGIGVVRYYSEKMQPIPKIEGIDIVSSVIIKAQTPEAVKKAVSDVRGRCDIVMVHGGDYGINRSACENPMVDVLCHPELGRRDSGLDHVCAKAAKENGVALEINFREMVESHKRSRSFIMSSMKRNVRLFSKYDAGIVVTSSAVTKWGMRAGRELASVANLLGMELGKAIEAASSVPEGMVRTNREKIAGRRWEGVYMQEGGANA